MLKDIIVEKVASMIYATGILVRSLSSQTYCEKNFEITPEQYLILLLIIENEGIHQRQICEITLKDRGNVARIVDILLEKKLIEKQPNSNGRRIFKIYPTTGAKSLVQKIAKTNEELKKIIYKDLTKEEIEITKKTLLKIRQNVKDKVKLQI